MVRLNEIRANEVAVDPPPPTDAGLVFIGRIRTPWTSRLACPRPGRPDGPVRRLQLFHPLDAALDGVAALERMDVLYSLPASRPAHVRHSPAPDTSVPGTLPHPPPVPPHPRATPIPAP